MLATKAGLRRVAAQRGHLLDPSFVGRGVFEMED
jgi:hypothetical protein